jgi:DNA processing protein
LADVFSIRSNVIHPVLEVTSYEALWTRYSTTTQLATLFKRFNYALPSDVARAEGFSIDDVECIKRELEWLMPFHRYAALFHGDFEYPSRLRDALHPIEVVYYRGNLNLLAAPAIAVIGSRTASEMGIQRAHNVAQLLVKQGFTVLSGLAEGIDTAAHLGAITAGGTTIAVVGTALNTVYPKQNKTLHDELVMHHLVVSQVPFIRYARQDYQQNRVFFPERNKTMSALSLATLIIEASDTSGCLIQATAAIEQGRKLFILKSCFDGDLSWPHRFLAQGAVKINDRTELIEQLRTLPTAAAG